MAASHIDNPTPARLADPKNWSNPVLVPPTAPVQHRPTEDQIWADNAATSRYFGRTYICYNDFQFVPVAGNVGPVQPTVAVSGDGGATWATHGIAPPINSNTDGFQSRFDCGSYPSKFQIRRPSPPSAQTPPACAAADFAERPLIRSSSRCIR